MVNILPTDSMDTIQKKLNKGGEIHFEQGTYRITKQLILKGGSEIYLTGATLRRSANIQSIFLNSCKTSTKGYKGAGNISIINGTFEGMGKYQPDNLLTFFHSHNIWIENVTFLDNLCHAVELNSTKSVKILNCKFLGCNTQETYQEAIQIDAAYAKGFWLSGSSKTSKCYDGTMCEDIIIEGCLFDRSEYRKNPSACIGTHTQILGGGQHKDIKILQNRFKCDGTAACLSLIGMYGVQVLSNYFEKCGKVARIYSKEYSYTLSGDKICPNKADGVCEGIIFKDNVECGYIGTNKCSGIYAKAANNPHKVIVVAGNEFVKSNDYEKYYLYAENCEDVTAENNRTKLKAKIT